MTETTDQPSDSLADQPGLFIVGMSRAATTWLAKCLNEHSQTAVFGENGYWGKLYVEPAEGGRYSAAQVGEILAQQKDGRMVLSVVGEGPGTLRTVTTENIGEFLEGEYDRLAPPVTPGELYSASLAAVARAESKPLAVDKTPQNVYWISRILKEMPHARFLSMLREPYGFMLSYKFQGKRSGGDLWKAFRRLYHPIACAFVWRAYVRASLSAQAQHADRVLLVRFSEVREQRDDVLRRVQEHFALDAEDLAGRVPPDNTSFPSGQRPELSAGEVFWMNRVGGRVMRKARFERRASGFHPIQALIPLLTLPIWVIRNAGPFRREMNISVIRYVVRLLIR